MKPSKQQKLLAPRLAIYEFEQFFLSLRILREYHQTKKQHDWKWNCALEGTHLHARNLLDFFQARKNDDVICEDFGFKTRPVEGSYELDKRINKNLSHLTYSRLDEQNRTLDLRAFEPLVERCKEFLASPDVLAFVEQAADEPDGDADDRNWRRDGRERWIRLRRKLELPNDGGESQ